MHVIAVDLGAESGRVMRVGFDGARLEQTEIHRFPNVPVPVCGTLYWDVLRLWHEIMSGIAQAVEGASSIGVDSWGVDFALLDRNGDLLANPVHYRDSRTDGMMEWVFERVPRRTVFERTGIQFMALNTLYQMASLVAANSPQLEQATLYLTFPDLFNHWLTGARVCEFTHATTTQMFNPRTGSWDVETLSALNIPAGIFPEIVQPGTRLGAYQGVPVMAVTSHDTASAVVAVPAARPNYAYLSSGTWSLLGMELDHPVINDASYQANVTNEGGYGGTYRFLKNVVGLWIAQQCRAAWRNAGTEYSYDDLTRLAAAAEPFRSLIDPDAPVFNAPGDDMPERVQTFCERTGQPVPQTAGQIMRAIYESLACKYRYALGQLVAIAQRRVDVLHVIGGGARNALLCQMTADSIGREVVAGPFEATALGNAIVQLIALGELADLHEAREAVRRSVETHHYTPQQTSGWDEMYERFCRLVATEEGAD
ncbi:MAG: rhamnulokinase [Anaerolineae bacterium]|nr:rhamnulokinase [Anaerolineae bacterium]